MNGTQKREIARALAKEALAKGRPLDWFEELYRKSESEGVAIPWVDRVPNPNAIALLERFGVQGNGRSALKIGSGLGDDAEHLESLGFNVTAFDISPTAVRLARERYPDSRVNYLVADLFDLPDDRIGAFDFVWESYTLQVLPRELRKTAIDLIPKLVGPYGELLVVTRAKDELDLECEMPWPLTRSEMTGFENAGLDCAYFEDYADCETAPVRRFRALYRKTAQGKTGAAD